MKKLETNEILQWAGTACFMSMYVIMNFFKEYNTLQIIAGLCGSTFYLIWCVRVANKPQMIVNTIGMLVCVLGLVKTFG
jgi:hypothetical protein